METIGSVPSGSSQLGGVGREINVTPRQKPEAGDEMCAGEKGEVFWARLNGIQIGHNRSLMPVEFAGPRYR